MLHHVFNQFPFVHLYRVQFPYMSDTVMNTLQRDSPRDFSRTPMQWLTVPNSADGFKAFNILYQIISRRAEELQQYVKCIHRVDVVAINEANSTTDASDARASPNSHQSSKGTMITGEEAKFKSSK